MKIGTLDGVLVRKGDHTSRETLYQIPGEFGFEGLEIGLAADYDQAQ